MGTKLGNRFSILALYASTSKTGESESGLVIKSLADVAKACRAIDASSLLKRVRTPFGKPRNYNIGRDNRSGNISWHDWHIGTVIYGAVV